MGKQIEADFKGVMDWAAKISLIAPSTDIAPKFQGYDPEPKKKTTDDSQDKEDEKLFDPETDPEVDGKQVTAFITLARFLAERSDDPKTGVGAVIVDKNRKVVGLGWNGFPTKAGIWSVPQSLR